MNGSVVTGGDFLDHCRRILTPSSRSDIQKRQCICQLSYLLKIIFGVDPELQNRQSNIDLPRFHASKWSNCFYKPSRICLVFDQPLPTTMSRLNLANAKLFAEPWNVMLTQLGRFDPHSNACTESVGRVSFEQSHDGAISIDESSKVSLVDFGNRLSHGVNHAQKEF
jgi:hypothetical protein